MSQTNTILGNAFHQHPDAVGATIDPMGMIKLHFTAMPVFAGVAQRWVPGAGGRCQEIGLSEFGNNPGFEAASAFIMNPIYSGPPIQTAKGGIRTTAMIQAENRLKEAALLQKAQGGAAVVPGLDELGLPVQTETIAEPQRSTINDRTPVEGLVGFKMAPREGVQSPVPVASFSGGPGVVLMPRATAETVAVSSDLEGHDHKVPPALARDPLADLLATKPVSPKTPSREFLTHLILALDLGFNGNHDLKKMRETVAAMADAVRKGAIGD
jgi:hypothetical protein